VERLPHLKVTIVDLPATIECARKTMRPCARLHLEEGDVRALAHREVFDGVMINDLLHSFGRVEKRLILSNALAALKAGGRLAVSKFHMDHEPAGPNPNVLFSLKMFMNSAVGYLETDQEVIGMIHELGARVVVVKRLGEEMDATAIIAEK
jgi:SAM-dependent methyltransferase